MPESTAKVTESLSACASINKGTRHSKDAEFSYC